MVSPKKKSRSSKGRKLAAVRRESRQWQPCRLHAAHPLSRLETETPILTDLVAERVCAEAANFLDDERPMRFAPALAARARRLYGTSDSFTRRIGRWDGLEWLRSFMRHWLAARLQCECRDLFCRLPEQFEIGRPIST